MLYCGMGLMPLDAVPLTEINDRTAKCAEQDQTACMYTLILLYTFRKIGS